MKRLLTLIFFTISFSYSYAQIQNGKVRTPGRDGKPGVGIENVLIRVKGSHNDEPSDKNGVFSLQLRDVRMGDGFQIASIRKVGYEIFDKNLRFPSTFPYSNVPIDIVMIKSEDLAREKQAWIDKGYSNAEKLYLERLEDLKNKHTEEKERNAHLKDLEEWYEKYQGLIEGMADYYVHVDYDRLDEGLRQITNAIQEGEYLLADSLINVYAPNLEEDVKNSIKAHQNIRERKQYGERIVAKAVSDSIEQVKKDEKTSSFLFAKFTTSVNANKWDDAIHYLKLRADLDTTNIVAVRDYAELCDKQNMFADCEKYYLICLRSYTNLNDIPNIAAIQNNLGGVYRVLHDYTSSEKYYKLALENHEQLFRQNLDTYRAGLAFTQNNIGNLYRDLHDYANCEKFYMSALENFEHLFRQNPEAYREDLAGTQNNLGNLYSDLHDYANCEKFYMSALENTEHLFRQNPDAYREYVANIHYNLGNLYSDLQDYANSKKFYKFALENWEQLFRQNPDAYRAYLAMTCWSLMFLYGEMENLEQYDQYLDSALKLTKELYSSQPANYVNVVIALQNRKIRRLLENDNVDEAFNLALKTYSMDESNEMSKNYMAECYNNKAYEYAKASDYAYAHKIIDKAISLVPYEPIFYDSKGEFLLMQGKNDEALKMWIKVIELKPNFLDGYPEGTELSNGLKQLGLIE